MKKRKVLVLNYEFPPLGGGQANANYFLFQEFSKYPECDFILITSSTDTYREEHFSQNIKIYYLDIGKKNTNLHDQSIKNLLANTKQSFSLAKKIIKKEKIDIIMAWSYPAIGIGYILKKLYKIPYISLLRGSDVPFYEKKWYGLDRYIFQYLAPIFWRNSQSVIANSKGLQEMALDIAPHQNIDIIPNGVDTTFYCFDAKKKNTDTFIILGVGRLVERKGFDILIRAVSDIKTTGKKIEVWLVGDGPEKQNLKSLALSSNVDLKLLGLKDRNQLQSIYQESSIFCLPSKNEGMSNTLLEAIASGLPVIVTDVGGSRELLNDNGFILDKNNEEAFGEKINFLYNNPEKIQYFSKKSQDLAKKLSWEHTADSFLKSLN